MVRLQRSAWNCRTPYVDHNAAPEHELPGSEAGATPHLIKLEAREVGLEIVSVCSRLVLDVRLKFRENLKVVPALFDEGVNVCFRHHRSKSVRMSGWNCPEYHGVLVYSAMG